MEQELKKQREISEEYRLETIRLKEKIVEQKQRDQRTLADLEIRYETSKTKNLQLKNQIQTIQSMQQVPVQNIQSAVTSNVSSKDDFFKYSFLGVGVVLSTLLVQKSVGFLEFKHQSVIGIGEDLLVGAVCGCISSLIGYGINQKLLRNLKNWIMPSFFSGILGCSLTHNLGYIVLKQKSETSFMEATGVCAITPILAGGVIHYAYQKWYGESKNSSLL